MPLVRRGRRGTGATAPSAPATASLQAADAEERWIAAREAAEAPEGAAILADALALESDDRVRDALFTGLARIGTAECVDKVLPYLRSNDAGLRTGAVDTLRAMPAHLVSRVPELLADPDPDVRLLSCELARELPSAEANMLLAGLLDRETEKNVSAAAIEVLAEIGQPEVVQSLQRCAARFAGDAFLEFSISIVMNRIGATPAAMRE
jgi:HEAT repeat protein